VQIKGIGKRNKIMLDFCVKYFRLLEGENYSKVFVVPSERGPRYCQHIEGDSLGTLVPKGRWIVVSGVLGRVGLMAPEEYMSGQQMAITDHVCDQLGWMIIKDEFSYAALAKFGGSAFHSSSCGAFGLSVLLLPRFSNFFRGGQPRPLLAPEASPGFSSALVGALCLPTVEFLLYVQICNTKHSDLISKCCQKPVP